MSDRPEQTGQFERSRAAGKIEADFDLDPSVHIEAESVHEQRGELLVIRSRAEGACRH
jgi:transcription termination factor Rho